MFNTQLYKDYLRPREKHKLPSGKRLHSYVKPLFLMGKSTINGDFQ